jgi:hypothetical protein
MSAQRIYFVTTARPKIGKAELAARWWAEKGIKQFEAVPGTKSVRAYVAQFGLSGGNIFTLEIWQEIENYASFDRRDKLVEEDVGVFAAFHTDFLEYYELGPSRIMGDWADSRPAIAPA